MNMGNRKKLIITFFCILRASWLTAEPLVQVSEGFLRGTTEITRRGRNISSFLGIPYGEPPLEELR